MVNTIKNIQISDQNISLSKKFKIIVYAILSIVFSYFYVLNLKKMDNNLLKSSIGRLRIIGIIEGISFILLLGLAMPLKYVWGMPLAVRVIGALHGFLFVLFLYLLIQVKLEKKWDIVKMAKPLIASLLPFGTFIYDKQLKKEQEAIS